VGDANYSPLVQVLNAAGVIYNAPIVAFNVTADQINFPNGNVDYTKVHDQVLAIDPVNMTVTLNLITGFSFGRPVWYISMDASIPLAAAIEHNTLAPLMANLPLGRDDSFSSPIERIFLAANGPEEGGCANPLRQGLSADLADGHRPNNVLAEYRPLPWITLLPGMLRFISGPQLQLPVDTAASCVKSSRS
jgi:hypothetical protein